MDGITRNLKNLHRRFQEHQRWASGFSEITEVMDGLAIFLDVHLMGRGLLHRHATMGMYNAHACLSLELPRENSPNSHYSLNNFHHSEEEK